MLSIVVAFAGGFLAGLYARAVAAGFGPDPADTRKEARYAFGALSRLPRPGRPPVVELATATVCALVAWRAAPPYLPGLAYAAVAGVLLAVVDWRTRRLPDVITIPSYPILALLLLPTGELPRALLGGVALAGVYGVLWFLRPHAMGLGDVKLAGLIGMVGGALGWQAWAVAALAGQFAGALYAIGLLITKKGDKSTEFPFGPFMLIGALAAVCLA
ncbi:prepilin peptidase [Thermoactinospora rubra]|uniref:prepilin peptidase n=1 Tax=Thermoactinospora rubra TaxID=1088767 RepID=UPI000A100CEE|nr:A24 family peptidase [Thermoactinospora rubra]